MGIPSREFGGLASSTVPGVDCDTQLWLAGLRADGRERDRTTALLHVELLRVARLEVRRRRTGHCITGPELDDLAHQAAADAMMAIIRVSRAVDQDLTARQRSAFVELVWQGNTPEGLARQLGTNRDAVYKLVFDARRKIRARLTADGLLEER